ncbi:MAG TPA: hypothetical protein VFH73_06225 [Polyangia bacterium]|jgi:hypothetical protein|nr:hypothetical protein [Polyangia bacterium]
MAAVVDGGELAALARKYRALVALRTARDRGSPREAASGGAGDGLRETLAALAKEFPGCLRELDTLGASELARRADAAGHAAEGGALEPWMAWIAGYHRLMRATLVIKQDVGKRRASALTDHTAAALARTASATAGLPVDVSFVRAVAAPPHGRLGIVVLRALAAHLGAPATEIAATLFPPRRPRPYPL